MIDFPPHRPILVALAGPNGAGKSTFYEAHLAPAGLRFVNADLLARELRLGPYEAAEMAGALREQLVDLRQSFVFETVFSDPVGDKVAFLERADASGYTVLLCFIGLSDAKLSEQRVSMRVAQGGHDVPNEKLSSRFPRTRQNLQLAIRKLPHVWIFDNSNLAAPFRLLAKTSHGKLEAVTPPTPNWLAPLLPAAPKTMPMPGR